MTSLFEVQVQDHHRPRLDVFLTQQLGNTSRSQVKQWCSEGRVKVDGRERPASYRLQFGQNVGVQDGPAAAIETKEDVTLDLDIIWENDDIAVINKPAGLVVHPGKGHPTGTLAQALKVRYERLSGIGDANRAGIVHRLDKGTSGVIVIAKNDAAHRDLAYQWQAGTVVKVYQALVWGVPKMTEGEVETMIGRHSKDRQRMTVCSEGGKLARSRYKVTKTFSESCRMNVHILTGRTHQIRVHLAYLGHPVIGDTVYGRRRHTNLAQAFQAMPTRPMLHAALLRFALPGKDEIKSFKADIPSDFLECEAALKTWPY